MAKLTKLTDKRSQALRYRLRYSVHFPDGSRVERSRRYETVAVARANIEAATVLENRARQLQQTQQEIVVWRHEALIPREEGKKTRHWG